MIVRIARLAACLLRDRMGGTAVFFALAAPVALGAAGIGVETGLWYMTRRQAQTAADASAIAGALQLLRGQPTAVVTAAVADSARNGFPNTAPNAVTINTPPTSGSYAGSAQSVEAI